MEFGIKDIECLLNALKASHFRLLHARDKVVNEENLKTVSELIKRFTDYGHENH